MLRYAGMDRLSDRSVVASDFVKSLMLYNLFDEIDPSGIDELEERVKHAEVDFDVDRLRISDTEVEYLLKEAFENQAAHSNTIHIAGNAGRQAKAGLRSDSGGRSIA